MYMYSRVTNKECFSADTYNAKHLLQSGPLRWVAAEVLAVGSLEEEYQVTPSSGQVYIQYSGLNQAWINYMAM